MSLLYAMAENIIQITIRTTTASIDKIGNERVHWNSFLQFEAVQSSKISMNNERATTEQQWHRIIEHKNRAAESGVIQLIFLTLQRNRCISHEANEQSVLLCLSRKDERNAFHKCFGWWSNTIFYTSTMEISHRRIAEMRKAQNAKPAP